MMVTPKLNTVQSVHRAIAILRLLTDNQPFRLSEISRQTNTPKTTAFMILQTLEIEGLVERKEDGKYQISAGIFELVFDNSDYLNTMKEIGTPFLQKLTDHTNMTSHLAVKVGRSETVYVAKVNSVGFVQFNTHIGQRHYLHLTSVGKAILMRMSDEAVLKLLPPELFSKKTPSSLESPQAVIEQLKIWREKGYAVEDEEDEIGIRCIGAPLIDSKGRTLGAISVTELKEKLDRKNFDIIGNEVMNIANELARSLEAHGFFS